jgi:hypothetical protein
MREVLGIFCGRARGASFLVLRQRMKQRTITILITELDDHGYKLSVNDTELTVQEHFQDLALQSDALHRAARMLAAKATDLKGLRL